MNLLFPQISYGQAISVVNSIRALSTPEVAERHIHFSSEMAEYTAVGGVKVTERQLRDLRAELVGFAEVAGYPESSSDVQRAVFDGAAAVVLHKRMHLALGEAAKPGVWNFVSCFLAPDIVRWRFPGSAEGTPVERFVSGRRNVFQRVWWRAEVLSDRTRSLPYEILKALGEDELVQIMERPQLAGFKPLAKEIAGKLVTFSQVNPGIPRRYLIRETQKRLMRFSAFLQFELLGQDELGGMVEHAFHETIAAFRRSGTLVNT